MEAVWVYNPRYGTPKRKFRKSPRCNVVRVPAQTCGLCQPGKALTIVWMPSAAKASNGGGVLSKIATDTTDLSLSASAPTTGGRPLLQGALVNIRAEQSIEDNSIEDNEETTMRTDDEKDPQKDRDTIKPGGETLEPDQISEEDLADGFSGGLNPQPLPPRQRPPTFEPGG